MITTPSRKPLERQSRFAVQWISLKFLDHTAFQILARIFRTGDEFDLPEHIRVWLADGVVNLVEITVAMPVKPGLAVITHSFGAHCIA